MKKVTMTEKNHITILYGRVTSSHKTRNMDPVDYSKDDLSKWLYSNGYKVMFRKWKRSGFIKDLAPSLDRLDTRGNYSLDNLELVTWHENQSRAYRDRIEGKGRMGDHNLGVTQLTLTGEHVKDHVSVSDASRDTGVNRGNISSAAEGRLPSAGKFIWIPTEKYNEYKNADAASW